MFILHFHFRVFLLVRLYGNNLYKKSEKYPLDIKIYLLGK